MGADNPRYGAGFCRATLRFESAVI